VQSFDWDYLAGCRALNDKLVLCALGHKEFTSEKLDQVAKSGASIVGWEDKYTTAATIQAIHDRGYKVWVWTVDKPERVVELVGAKADGIITNRPAQTRLVIEQLQQAR
jgi:glycerophosphoryl diester phosphodiesterase